MLVLYDVEKERDACSPIYPQAAAPGHKLEALRPVSNFCMSDFLRAVTTRPVLPLPSRRSSDLAP